MIPVLRAADGSAARRDMNPGVFLLRLPRPDPSGQSDAPKKTQELSDNLLRRRGKSLAMPGRAWRHYVLRRSLGTRATRDAGKRREIQMPLMLLPDCQRSTGGNRAEAPRPPQPTNGLKQAHHVSGLLVGLLELVGPLELASRGGKVERPCLPGAGS
jgi:hypothetical protein